MEQAKFYDEKKPVMSQIRAMEKGEVLAFPIEKTLYIRSNVTIFSYAANCKYSTHVNRENKTIEVTRVL